MKLETKLDFISYLQLMFIITYRKPIILVITIINIATLIMVIFYISGFRFLFDGIPFSQLILCFFIVVVLPVSIYFNARKTFSTHGLIKEKIIYEITEDKICQTGETFHSEMEWTKIYKVVEMKHWILIYHNRQIANLIPKESFGENLMEFRNIIRSKKIKAKLK